MRAMFEEPQNYCLFFSFLPIFVVVIVVIGQILTMVNDDAPVDAVITVLLTLRHLFVSARNSMVDPVIHAIKI